MKKFVIEITEKFLIHVILRSNATNAEGITSGESHFFSECVGKIPHYVRNDKTRTVFRIFLLVLGISISLQAQIGSLEPTMKLVTLNNVTLPFQNGMIVPSFEKQPRTTISLAGQWKKKRFAANHTYTMTKRDAAGYASILTEAAGRELHYYDDSAWETKNIPSVENTMNANEKVPEYYEDGVWYRTKFSVPESLQQKFAKLNFYSVNYVADVWLNGQYLGWHEGGYTPFSFDVSSALRFDSANVLVVRVDNIPWGTRQDIVPYYNCDWFNYTGIIHDVYLEFSDKISVVRADAVPQNINGLIKTTIVVKNKNLTSQNVDVAIAVYTAKKDSASLQKEICAELADSPVAISGTSQQTFSVPSDSIAVWQTNLTVLNPQLWSPKNPNLYIMKVTISQNGIVKDEFYTQFGVRTFATAGDRFLLNEKEIFMHGVARHEDHPVYGRSIPRNVIYSDLKLVKSVYANYLRTGHYPNHPYTYLIADRLGIIIMEELPVWWFDVASAWAIQNAVRKIHLQMFREMVFKDYNRASIALWSTSNECKDVAGRSTFLQTVQAELDGLYPDGRLITQSAAADRPGAYDQSQKYTDAPGWTLYFGIFYDPLGVGDYFGTKYFLVDAHDYYPDKPLIATEYGYWSGETMAHLDKQVETFDSVFYAFKPRIPITETGKYNYNGYVGAITWWCIFDWYTHQLSGGFQSMGLFRMNRQEIKKVGNRLSNMYKVYSQFSEYITSVKKEETEKIPIEFSLTQNYPNPFNPSTTISFSIPRESHVQVKIYDVLGKEVTTLVNDYLEAGKYSEQWNAKNIPSGMYFYRISAGNFSETRKMLLIK